MEFLFTFCHKDWHPCLIAHWICLRHSCYNEIVHGSDWAAVGMQIKSLSHQVTSQQFLPQVFAIYFPQFHQDPLNDRSGDQALLIGTICEMPQ
jgi:hypothetical protein